MNFVLEALELEDTLKNFERRNATGWFALNPGLLFFPLCLSFSEYKKKKIKKKKKLVFFIIYQILGTPTENIIQSLREF